MTHGEHLSDEVLFHACKQEAFMKNPFLGLFRARDKPGRRTSPRARDAVSAAPGFYYGASLSGKSVTPTSAIQVSAALRLRAGHRRDRRQPAAACVRGNRYGAAERPASTRSTACCTTNRMPEMTSFVWREVMLSHLLLYGNSYCRSSVRAAAASWGCIRFCPTAWPWTGTARAS